MAQAESLDAHEQAVKLDNLMLTKKPHQEVIQKLEKRMKQASILI